jgi:hypothetical protein
MGRWKLTIELLTFGGKYVEYIAKQPTQPVLTVPSGLYLNGYRNTQAIKFVGQNK